MDTPLRDGAAMKRAVVTGCAGFIGSHLCERLVSEGWRVLGIDAFTPYYPRPDKEANLAALSREPAFTLVEADLVECDLDALMAGADAVFHLAAQPGVRPSFGDGFVRYVHDNILATQRLLEAATNSGCPRVVWASSSSVYGDAAAYPCIEGVTPTAPRSPYGATKRACEDLAEIYRTKGLETVGLRYFTVYGPRQRPDMAMRRLCEALVQGDTFPVYGDGAQSRDFTYVADAVDATFRAGVAPSPAPVYNVGGGNEATLTEVIETLEELAGRPALLDRREAQAGDVRRTSADTALAQTTLGWTPRVSLVEGLADELTWVDDRHRASTTLAA